MLRARASKLRQGCHLRRLGVAQDAVANVGQSRSLPMRLCRRSHPGYGLLHNAMDALIFLLMLVWNEGGDALFGCADNFSLVFLVYLGLSGRIFVVDMQEHRVKWRYVLLSLRFGYFAFLIRRLWDFNLIRLNFNAVIQV